MRKKVFMFLISVVFLIPVISQSNSIGEVMYSILSPLEMKAVMGDDASDWVLLDGRDIRGTVLANLTGMTNVPDARGMFIRGMNLGREDGDSQGNRSVGSYQSDSIGSHSHPFSGINGLYGHNYENSTMGWQDIGNSGSSFVHSGEGGDGSNPYRVGIRKGNFETESNNGSETRPENITLYIYIKVN